MGRGRGRIAALVAALAVGASGVVAPRTAAAQASPAAAPTAAARSSSYADLLHADRSGEGFVARQLREAKTYPYLDRANRLLAQGRRDEARAELAAYLERDPADVKVRYEYGVLLAALGDPRGAEREMTEVLRARPGFGPALLYRANARQALGESAAALADFEAAARSGALAPQDRVRALDAAWEAAIAQGRDDVALRALGELAAAPPSAARDLAHARLLAARGESATALPLLARVSEDPDASQAQRDAALRERVVLLAKEGRLADARSAGETALAARPDDPELLRELAEIARRQGDDAASVAYLERAARLDPSPDVRRAEVYAAERAGDTARAADVLRGLLESNAVGSEQALADRSALAVFEARRGRHAEAGRLYLEAYRASDGRDPELLVKASRELAAAGDGARARSLLREAIAGRSLPRGRRAGRTLPRARRAELAEELANLELAAGNRGAALRDLTLAAALGRDGFRVQQARGDLLLRDGRYADALDAYRAAAAKRDDPRSALGEAYALAALGKPGLAVPELHHALAGTPPLGPASRREALSALGFLEAELDRPRAAADAWTDAQRIRFDPELEVRRAREERLAGDPAAARAALSAVDPSALPVPLQAMRLDELAALARAEADLAPASTDPAARQRLLRAAIADLERAIALEPSADREYRLGLLYVELGEPEAAIPPLERSLEVPPLVPSHAATLGYAYQDVGRWDDAGAQFERALAADRDLLPLYEDLGYVRVKEVRNDDAIRLFEQVIDNTPLYPVHDAQERDEVEDRRLRMRREVSELSRRFSLVAYTSICFGTRNCEIGATTPLSAAASQSQGGVELAWRPPVVGYRDGRVLEVISRTLFEQDVNSIVPRGSTTVVTLGLRWKPIPWLDGYLSAERLFGAGSDAQDNVLLRGTLGWQRGYGMQPGVPRWWYTTAYADVARTVEGPRDWFFYAEGRHGSTFNFRDRGMVTPHLYLRGRFQTGDGDDYQEVDAGLGVLLKLLFREDRYRDCQSSFELLPRIGYDVWNSEERDLTLSLTAVVRF